MHAKTYRYADPSVVQEWRTIRGEVRWRRTLSPLSQRRQNSILVFSIQTYRQASDLDDWFLCVIPLAKAREIAKELAARVALGHDVAAEKQQRKAEAIAKIEAEKNAMHVSKLTAEYYSRQTEGAEGIVYAE